MNGGIFQIIIGLLLWKLVPRWIEYGDRKTREYLKLGCNIIGVILVVLGIVSILTGALGSPGVGEPSSPGDRVVLPGRKSKVERVYSAW